MKQHVILNQPRRPGPKLGGGEGTRHRRFVSTCGQGDTVGGRSGRGGPLPVQKFFTITDVKLSVLVFGGDRPPCPPNSTPVILKPYNFEVSRQKRGLRKSSSQPLFKQELKTGICSKRPNDSVGMGAGLRPLAVGIFAKTKQFNMKYYTATHICYAPRY